MGFIVKGLNIEKKWNGRLRTKMAVEGSVDSFNVL